MRLNNLGEFFSFFEFDAAGNNILVVDALNSGNGSERIADILLNRSGDIGERTLHKPDIFAVVTPSGKVNARVDFWNPDGSRERVCGNALRSLPLFFKNTKLDQNEFCVETLLCDFDIGYEGELSWVRFRPEAIFSSQIKDDEWMIDCGTPHLVLQTDDLINKDKVEYALRKSCGSDPVNVTLWKYESNFLKLRTFERGVGETGSCGTGAISAFYVFAQGRRLEKHMNLMFYRGNQLNVEWEPGGSIILRGQCKICNQFAMYL